MPLSKKYPTITPRFRPAVLSTAGRRFLYMRTMFRTRLRFRDRPKLSQILRQFNKRGTAIHPFYRFASSKPEEKETMVKLVMNFPAV